MNATSSSGGFLGSANVATFAYGVGAMLGILLLITAVIFVSYYYHCSRRTHAQSHALPQRNVLPPPDDPEFYVVDVGLDEATLHSYPMLFYSEVRVKNKDATTTTATCCSICLADYRGSDMLRLLPDCGHLFHLKCVDPWLRRNPTCPVCRTSPIPTPLSTPLVEVVPLASQRVQ
ncbi:unnamed protein product [Ilex paraguariensis]|uniref:RING-type domain-containing protein n=1 Tax=Ilex paraguariensis TaxID=185542 RepID=A0ABC8QUN5_9AQUA